MDKSLRDLIDIIHFTESVSAKIHRLLDEAQIYRAVKEAFAESKRYDASILLLSDDGSKLRIGAVSAPAEKLRAAEKRAQLRLRDYEIDLGRSSIYRQVVGEGKTLQVSAGLILGELLPRPLARLISKTMGYESRPAILTPLRRHEKIIGALAMSSVELGEYLVPSVRTLARHISSALELADENLELRRATEEIRRRGEELAALNEIGRAISSTFNPTQVLMLVAEKTAQVCDVERCSILLLDEAKKELVPMMSQYASGAADAELWRIFKEETYAEQVDDIPAIREVIRERRTVILLEESRSRVPLRWTEPFGIKSLLLVPLTSKDAAIGLMALDYTTEGRYFSTEQVDLATAIGSQVAVAIENARLHEETRRRFEELSAIEEIVHQLSSTLDFQKVIELLLEKAIEVTHAWAGGIAVLNEKRTGLLLLAHQGYPVQSGSDELWRWSIDRGIVGRVARTGEPSLVGDVSQDPDYAKVIPGTRSQLTVPVIREDKVAGTIVLESPQLEGFTEEQARFVQHLAEHAAVAMENARLYERLKESEERYRTYVENVPDVIWETDADGHFTYWSPQVESLTGYAPWELVGHTAYEFLIHPDDAREFRARIHHMLEEGEERCTIAHRNLHRDGSISHAETSISKVLDDVGESVKFQGVTRDVSDRVRLHAQLIQSAKLSGIGEMISGVAHELNNPLTTVMGYAQLLQVSDVDENIKEDLRRIYDDALRAQRIVQSLLTFARQKKPRRSSVDINEIIKRTLVLQKYQLRVDNVEVVTELASTLPWTMADDSQLQQVFLNFINNAHQAMAEDRGGGVLTVRSELRDDDLIRVSFADTGPGIPAEIMDRVFDPFFTTKDVGSGTGLGLSVSHGIVQEHGGRIWVESVPNQGATFFVELPVTSWIEDVEMPSLDGEL